LLKADFSFGGGFELLFCFFDLFLLPMEEICVNRRKPSHTHTNTKVLPWVNGGEEKLMAPRGQLQKG
jgi:hypothetical protein